MRIRIHFLIYLKNFFFSLKAADTGYDLEFVNFLWFLLFLDLLLPKPFTFGSNFASYAIFVVFRFIFFFFSPKKITWWSLPIFFPYLYLPHLIARPLLHAFIGVGPWSPGYLIFKVKQIIGRRESSCLDLPI